MKEKINNLKQHLIANSEIFTFSEIFNQSDKKIYKIHGSYGENLFGFDVYPEEIRVWQVLNENQKENTLKLLKQFGL
jgi:hypothetical protein